MYWPNESELNSIQMQIGPREAFGDLVRTGYIKALEIYSYRFERKKFLSILDFERDALATVRNFKPDILFVQHVTNFKFSDGFWADLRNMSKNTLIVYHDADPYDRFVKRIDSSMRQILRVADLTFICGLGFLHDAFSRLTSGKIKYMPHSYDAIRFGILDPLDSPKTLDIVMIGNRGVRRRLPFLYVPGGRRRNELVSELDGNPGAGFAVYGTGWDKYQSSRGKISFFEQEKTIQSARISVNWDHFDDIPFYFSDRLPISLVAAVPHVTTFHQGYQLQFKNCPGLYFITSPKEIVDATSWLLSHSDRALADLGIAARQWITQNLSADHVYKAAYQTMVSELQGMRI